MITLKGLWDEAESLPDKNPILDGPQTEKGLKVLSKSMVLNTLVIHRNNKVQAKFAILFAVVAVLQLILLIVQLLT